MTDLKIRNEVEFLIKERLKKRIMIAVHKDGKAVEF